MKINPKAFDIPISLFHGMAIEVVIEDAMRTPSTAGKSCPTKTRKQPRSPYSLRSCRQNNEEIDYTQQNVRDELS